MAPSKSLKFVLCEKNFTHALIENMAKPMNSSVVEITVRIEDENYGYSRINPK